MKPLIKAIYDRKREEFAFVLNREGEMGRPYYEVVTVRWNGDIVGWGETKYPNNHLGKRIGIEDVPRTVLEALAGEVREDYRGLDPRLEGILYG